MAAIPARGLAAFLGAALAFPSLAATTEQDLERGVALVQDGDFEGAITPLAAVVQALTDDLSRRAELSKAYLFLGVAYLELGQELEARGKFREAIRNVPKLKLSAREFSAQVIRVFETERLAAQPKKRRNLLLPLLLVSGGGAATAGIAASGGGSEAPPTTGAGATTTTSVPTGGGPGTTTTTTTTPGGPGPTTTTTSTTTTTVPGSTTTTTLPGSTTTTTLPASTTTTTSTTSTTTSTTTTTTPTTSTTTTTTLPSCSYTLSPDRNFQFGGGNGVCNVNVSPQSCRWNVEVFPGSANWLTLNGPTSGTGNGSVGYTVAALNLVGSRNARIRAQQDPGAGCDISQQGLLGAHSDAGLEWESRLDVAGGRGQVVINGRDLVFQGEGAGRYTAAARDGVNRVEATLVSADGKPGVWLFDLQAGYEPGSLHVIAGRVRLVGAGSVLFEVAGAPGERFVFAFKASPGGAATRPVRTE